MTPLLLDLTRDPTLGEDFDLIVTAMALHHVDDVSLLLSQLGGMLSECGWLVMADLCLEDGSFHEPRKVPHNGFAPESLANTMTRSLGHADCRWQVVHHLGKNGRLYDIFLLVAHRIPS